MKTLGLILLYTSIVLGLMQFIKIDVPKPPVSSPDEEIVAPKEVMSILKRSCYECHSGTTKWPWYSDIAPISFSVRGHVKDGRAWLNYDIWGRYTDEQKKQRMEQTVHTVRTGQMPEPLYIWAHNEATLSKSDKKILIEWATKEGDKFK